MVTYFCCLFDFTFRKTVDQKYLIIPLNLFNLTVLQVFHAPVKGKDAFMRFDFTTTGVSSTVKGNMLRVARVCE